MSNKKIPTATTVQYVLHSKVQVSVEDLTDPEILKLNKEQLQIALKATRQLLLDCRSKYLELEKIINNKEVLRRYLEKLES